MMRQLVLIFCVVPGMRAVFAPPVLPKVVLQGAPSHKLNLSQTTQELFYGAWKNYTARLPKPNASWTIEDWKESLVRCKKSIKETRQILLPKVPHDEVSLVERLLEAKEAEDNQLFRAFLVKCKTTAQQLNLSRTDEIIKHFRETLQPGCLREMPMTVLVALWKKNSDFVMADAPEDEKGRTDIFLRRIKLRELSHISHAQRKEDVKVKSARSTLYTMWCMDEASKVGLSQQDTEAVTDLIDEYLAEGERMNKSGWTPKQASDYQRTREMQFFELIEKAVANDPDHSEQIREAFELIRIRHERLKIREKVQFLLRVKRTASEAHLSKNTTTLLVRELKKYLIITHGHIGFGDEDERRADQELTMSFGIIKMLVLDKIPREEVENVDHFFFMLSRDLPDDTQMILRLELHPVEDQEPFENYTTTLARTCQMWNDSLYSFWETHILAKPSPLLLKIYNQDDFFKRRAKLLVTWRSVKRITSLTADESQATNLACFFEALEKDFVKARRSALYSHVQTDEMNFVGSFRKNIRSCAKWANISTDGLDLMLEIVNALNPNITLPEIEDPTVDQLLEAYNSTHNFRTSFKDQCYEKINDRKGLDKFFEHLDAPFHRLRLTPQNLEDNGFICDTPIASEPKPRAPSRLPPRIVVAHPHPKHGHPIHHNPIHGPIHTHPIHGPIHVHVAHENPNGLPAPPGHKVHHHHHAHNPVGPHKPKHHRKHETSTEAESDNSTSE